MAKGILWPPHTQRRRRATKILGGGAVEPGGRYWGR